jgi:hypothetical protein
MRWDAAFAAGDFVTGYYDRVERKITEVPFGRVRLVPGDRFSFQASDPDGCAHERFPSIGSRQSAGMGSKNANNDHGDSPPRIMKQRFAMIVSLTPALSQRARGTRKRFALFYVKANAVMLLLFES